MTRLTALGSELTWDEMQRASHHHQRATAKAEQGLGERPAMQFLFWSPQQDQRRRLGRTLRVSSLSQLPLQSGMHEAKQWGALQGAPVVWAPSPWFL